MKKDDLENILDNLNTPKAENIVSHGDMKIPLLSFKKSSKAGLWLLIVPFLIAITVVIKGMGIKAGYLDYIRKFFAAIDDNVVLTYLIPLIFVGLPLFAMIINLLAICHFQQDNKKTELLITIKYRALNITVFLVAFVVLVFFLLPDNLSF